MATIAAEATIEARHVLTHLLDALREKLNPAARILSFKMLAPRRIEAKWTSPVWNGEPQLVTLMAGFPTGAGLYQRFDTWYVVSADDNRELVRLVIQRACSCPAKAVR